MNLFVLTTATAIAVSQLLSPCLAATIQTCGSANVTAANLTNPENSINYDVPDSNPPVTISFGRFSRPRPISQTSTLIAIITALPNECRTYGFTPFPVSSTYAYGGVAVTLGNLDLRCGPFTYDNACVTLRGLAEYMLLNQQFHESIFRVLVDGNLKGIGSVMNAIGAEATAVATS